MTNANNSLAASMVALIQRFVGTQPDALTQMRNQVEQELIAARVMVERSEAQLAAIDQLQGLINNAESEFPLRDDPRPIQPVKPVNAPPLKNAIVIVLDEDPTKVWQREELYNEIRRRGWGPGGDNPRNTFTARMRDLEKEKRILRLDRDRFTSLLNKEVPAM